MFCATALASLLSELYREVRYVCAVVVGRHKKRRDISHAFFTKKERESRFCDLINFSPRHCNHLVKFLFSEIIKVFIIMETSTVVDDSCAGNNGTVDIT
jgi:hypothetical protein